MEDLLEFKARTAIFGYCLNKLGSGKLDDSSESTFLKCTDEVQTQIPSFFTGIKFLEEENDDLPKDFRPVSDFTSSD